MKCNQLIPEKKQSKTGMKSGASQSKAGSALLGAPVVLLDLKKK